MSALPDLDAIRAGGKRALGRALTQLETGAGSAEVAAFLDEACRSGAGGVVGLTGPPGVGKSTLTDALIRHYRSRGESVSVLAIDPSSQATGGALLGDRTRLQTDPEDNEIFVRSMAARDRLGGLSDHAIAAIALLRAVTDRVIVESVGIGQSEGDIAQACDTLVLCIQPGSGDSLQFMKAGIMELPDIVAVTKADMGAAARRAASDVEGALSLSRPESSGWWVPVNEISAPTGLGLEKLVADLDRHADFLGQHGRLKEKRAAQEHYWLQDMIQSRFGSAGVEVAEQGGAELERLAENGPFTAFFSLSQQLLRKLGLHSSA